MSGLEASLSLPMHRLGQGRLLSRVSGSAPPFSPLDLSPALWLDFSDISTLFQASDGTKPVAADGDPIGYAADKSGNGRHMTQATTVNKPTYKASVQNGLGVARTDGTDCLRNDGIASLVAGDNAPLSVVVAFGTSQLSTSANGLYAVSDGTTSTLHRLRWGDPVHVFRRSSGVTKFATATGTTGAHILVDVFAGTRWLYQGHTEVVSGFDASTPSAPFTKFVIGASQDNSEFLQGDMFEFLLFARQLTQDERIALVTYIAEKWGITP